MQEVANHYYEENDGWFNLVDFYQDLVSHFLSLGYRHTPTKGEVKSHLFYLVRKKQYERREKKLGKRRTQEYRLLLNGEVNELSNTHLMNPCDRTTQGLHENKCKGSTS